MSEARVEIPSPDGPIPSFEAWPEGEGPFPAIIIYMDAPGIREELRNFARRIAGQGYYCLLPDMYYRKGRFRMDELTDHPDPRKAMFEHMGSLTNELVMRDTAAMLAYMDGHAAVKAGKKGCIGYCMSGQYVVSAAGTFPDVFAGSASLYGVSTVTDAPDSPHLLADRIAGELYFGFAETDEYVPDQVIDDLKSALDAHGVSYKCDIWPGTHHGFAFPEREAVYAEEASEKVWDIVFEMWDRTLR